MNTEKYQKDLFEFLSIPSISTQVKHKKDMDKACNWLLKKLTSLGFTSKVMQTKGHPVVYGELIQPKTYNQQPTTLLIYGHYDVQSSDPIKEWNTDPFKPEIKSGNIYCRGVADDKGQLYTWIAALEELKKNDKWPMINVKFLIEGEEEMGSKNLGEFIENNKTLLKANICAISDTHCLSEDQPMIDYGLR